MVCVAVGGIVYGDIFQAFQHVFEGFGFLYNCGVFYGVFYIICDDIVSLSSAFAR
jgi:hypothetical protein